MKSSSFVLSGTVKPMPASNGSAWSQNSEPAKISPASILSMSSASRPMGVRPPGSPASQTASHTPAASSGWQNNSKPNSPVYPVRDTSMGMPSSPPIRETENRNQPSSSMVAWSGLVQTTSLRIWRLSGP